MFSQIVYVHVYLLNQINFLLKYIILYRVYHITSYIYHIQHFLQRLLNNYLAVRRVDLMHLITLITNIIHYCYKNTFITYLINIDRFKQTL